MYAGTVGASGMAPVSWFQNRFGQCSDEKVGTHTCQPVGRCPRRRSPLGLFGLSFSVSSSRGLFACESYAQQLAFLPAAVDVQF